MARKEKYSYNEIPDKHVDWSLDETNNKQFSGESVQAYIKRVFDERAGDFYYDELSAKYLVFADEENRKKYLENPTLNIGLLIGSFDAPANYNMSITLISDPYNAIGVNDKGNIIKYSFKTQDKSGADVLEPVNIVYTITRGSVAKVVNASASPNTVVEFTVDDYLDEGTNYISISVQGKDTKAATSRTVTYKVVNLSLTDEFDISKIRDLSTESTIDIPFHLIGSSTKYMEYYLDGEKLSQLQEDIIFGNDVTQTKTISISHLSQGVHTIQLRAYIEDATTGEKFYSNLLYREFIVYTGIDFTSPLFVLKNTLPSSSEIITSSEDSKLYISGATQYIESKVEFASYNPTSSLLDVTINVEGYKHSITSTLTVSNETLTTYTFVPISSGIYTITLTGNGISRVVEADVAISTISISEITQSLTLNLQPTGKTNSSTDKDSWDYNDITSTLDGFYFNVNDGWHQVTYEEDNLPINAQRLVVSEDRTLNVNYNPFGHNINTQGVTFEMMFSTNKESADNALILDMMDSKGAGFIITSSEVRVRTTAGTEVSTQFKPGDNIRIGIVINPQSGVSELYRNLILLFVDGEIAGGIKYANGDSFGGKDIMSFKGTSDATINIGQIRCYTTALSWSQIINNWLLYQDTTEQMLIKYNNNDIYDTDGNISVDKLLNRAPVWMQTGPYKVIDNTTDKNTNIIIDVDYYNNQDPTKSFTALNLYERGQGTSSMFYPVKNLRPHFTKGGNTKLYDWENKLMETTLYSHKQNSRPVNEYTLKTDFAESSGTHNAGVARLWNDCLYNAKFRVDSSTASKILEIDGVAIEVGEKYWLRTQAQNFALEHGYQYDVRTTVDGFPMTLFVRESSSDQWHFHGKYNFLNDKSNVAVYGFEIPEIPEFAETFPLMQCWEFLDSSEGIALFQPNQDFDGRWQESFEGRFPDGSVETTQLKALYEWLSDETLTQARFRAEKYEHFDVLSIAAYYVYLMRYGGVDQTVKNAMFLSEDGQHWKFINYDNDTIFGLKNTGNIAFGPYINRNTEESFGTGIYCYAGHASRLWNLFEGDEAFMTIYVPLVDQALFNAKGEYQGNGWDSVISVFEDKQMNAWNARIYNLDAEEKYIANPTYLPSMQGSRKAHRRWWTSLRWAYLDSLWQTGNYKSNTITLKFAGAPSTVEKVVRIVAGMRGCYGYGINNVTYDHTHELAPNEDYVFYIDPSQGFNIGNPMAFYAAYGIKEFDMSDMISVLSAESTAIDINGAVSSRLGTQLRKFIIGASTRELSLTNYNDLYSGLDVTSAYRLTDLNIRGLKKQTSLNLTKNTKLERLLAYNSGLKIVNFAQGSPLVEVELPDTIELFEVTDSVDLEWSGVTFNGNTLDGSTTLGVKVQGCPKLSTDFDIIYNWYSTNKANASQLSLTMDNITWENVDAENIIAFGEMSTLKLKGVAILNEITSEQVERLKEVYGLNCFNKDYDFYFIAPDSVFISGPSEVIEGDSIQLTKDIVTDKEYIFEWSIVEGGTANQSINQEGLLTTFESAGARTVKVQVTVNLYKDGNKIIYATKTIDVKQAIRPTSGTISGVTNVSKDTEFTLSLEPSGINRDYSVEWSLSGVAFDAGYMEIKSQDIDSCIVGLLSDDAAGPAILTAKVTCDNGSTFNVTKDIKAGTTITVNMTSNQSGDTSVDSATATLTYGETTKTAQNGVSVYIPINTAIKVTFNAVTNYQTPEATTIVVLTDPVVVNGTYNTEIVNVTLSSWDGTDVSTQSIIIDGVTFVGTTASKKVAWGKTYEVSATYRDGYTTPQESILANQATRDLAIEYSPRAGTWITIDQSSPDAGLNSISGDINGEHIQAIRNGSHRYLGKYTADNTMTICQLDDSDSNFYADGPVASLSGYEGDVFVKLPHFYYMGIESDTDIWNVGFYVGEEKPAGNWNEWNGNILIGAERGFLNNSELRSVMNDGTETYLNQNQFETSVKRRGNGFVHTQWEAFNIIALLYFGMYGTVDASTIYNPNTTISTNLNNSSTLGMMDTIASSYFSNFLGIANWVSRHGIVLDPESIIQESRYEAIINPNTENRRKVNLLTIASSPVGKVKFGKYCDMIPLYSASNYGAYGFISNYVRASDGKFIAQSFISSNNTGLVGITTLSKLSSVYSRLMFIGNVVIESNLETYRALSIFKQACLKINISVEQYTLVELIEIAVNGIIYIYNPDCPYLYVYLNNGDNYTIEAINNFEGYIRPIVSGTANGFIEINLKYDHPEYGIFIKDIDGNLYTKDEWDTANNSKAVGVAIKTSAHSFVLAPEQSPSSMAWESQYVFVNGIVSSKDTSTIKIDYDGEGNTTKIIEQHEEGKAKAAEVCRTYTSKVGKIGYLPAYGELYEVYTNIIDVNAALTLVGGITLGSNYWTSTQGAIRSNAWMIDPSTGGGAYQDKDSTANVRAFTSFTPSEEILNGVYILDVSGNLYTKDEWDTANNNNVSNIVLKTDNICVAIAISNLPTSLWGDRTLSSTYPGVTITSSYLEAIKDFGGATNTNAILSQVTDGAAQAAEYCTSYEFKDGSKGYLPSAGELQILLDNGSEIDECLSLIGATLLPTSDGYWASTLYSTTKAYRLKGKESLGSEGKTNYDYYVRAVTAL